MTVSTKEAHKQEMTARRARQRALVPSDHARLREKTNLRRAALGLPLLRTKSERYPAHLMPAIYASATNFRGEPRR